MPHYIKISNFYVANTLITSLIGTLLFVLFVLIYKLLKARNPVNKFVNFVEWLFESIHYFF